MDDSSSVCMIMVGGLGFVQGIVNGDSLVLVSEHPSLNSNPPSIRVPRRKEIKL